VAVVVGAQGDVLDELRRARAAAAALGRLNVVDLGEEGLNVLVEPRTIPGEQI